MKHLFSKSIVINRKSVSQKGQALLTFTVIIASIVALIIVLSGTSPSLNTNSAVTFISAGKQDGWVLESSIDSGVGKSLGSTAATFKLGDDIAGREYRGILSFDTSSIPDGALITSVVLKIKQSGAVVGTNPFLTQGNLLVDLRNGTFGTLGLQSTDFSATASLQAAATFVKTPVNGWYSAPFKTAAARNNINKTGLTQVRLRFGLGDNANKVADYLSFFSGDEATAASRPVLVITYFFLTYTPTQTPTKTITPTLTITPTETLTPTITMTPTETLTPQNDPTPICFDC